MNRLHGLRARLTFANVTSLLALSVALGGTSWAAVTISGRQVRDGSLTGRDLKADSVTGKQVRGLSREDFADGEAPVDGTDGSSGPAGPEGPAGPAGEPGADGDQGPRGFPGVDGEPGPAGPAGADGPVGRDGERGPTGPTGPAGSPDTGGQILAKLRDVDGDGSELNADALDGLSSAAFQRRGMTTSCALGSAMSGLSADGDVVCRKDALGSAYFGSENQLREVTEVFPKFSVIASTTLPAGAYLLFGRGNLQQSDAVENDTVRSSSAFCRLIVPGVALVDLATLTPPTLSGTNGWSFGVATPFTLLGTAVKTGGELTVQLECAREEAGNAHIKLERVAITAVQLDGATPIPVA